jgi:pimeloyl-ACP methyl ester carboxylesterase
MHARAPHPTAPARPRARRDRPAAASRRAPAARAASSTAAAAAPASSSAPAARALTVALPDDGTPLELLFHPPAAPPSIGAAPRPPVLLVHGSYHAAWCWRDTFMPYLAKRGWPVYAVSLRGQGRSGRRPAPGLDAEGKVAGTLSTHARDLAAVCEAVAAGFGEATTPSAAGTPSRPAPVVCAHSFGGLILQELLSSPPPPPPAAADTAAAGPSAAAAKPPLPLLSGAAYLGSVPPSGNKAMVGRFLRRDPWLSARLTYAFITASFARDARTCRACFLAEDAPDALAESVRASIASHLSPLRLIDLQDMSRRVPLARPLSAAVPSLVLRGTEDGVVDAEAAEELARWVSGDGARGASADSAPPAVRRVEIEGLAHDVMLDVRWEEAARELAAWLETL